MDVFESFLGAAMQRTVTVLSGRGAHRNEGGAEAQSHPRLGLRPKAAVARIGTEPSAIRVAAKGGGGADRHRAIRD